MEFGHIMGAIGLLWIVALILWWAASRIWDINPPSYDPYRTAKPIEDWDYAASRLYSESTEDPEKSTDGDPWGLNEYHGPPIAFDNLDEELQRDLSQYYIDIYDLKQHVRYLGATVIILVITLAAVWFG